MSTEITVRGGAHGLAVCLEELEQAGRVLEVIGRDVAEIAAVVAGCGLDPGLALVGMTAPAEYLAAEAAVLACAGPRGAAGASARILTTAETTRAAALLYREGEEAAESLFDTVATSAGVALGLAAVPLLLGAGTVLGPAVLRSPAVRGGAIGIVVGLGHEADGLLLDHPWLVTAAADGVDGLIIGLGQGLPAVGTWLAWRAGRLGVPYPPRSQQEALGVILAATRGVALDESDDEVRVTAHTVGEGRAPRSVADLVADDGPTGGGTDVRLTGVPRSDGSWTWVVDVPGTQTFSPSAGANPWDLTSDVLLVAGQQTLTMRAVTRALADAQARTGSTGRSRVMLAGHSQGGLTAAALAADPAFRRRFDVTHVVTSGAPVAAIGVPRDVSVLSLEHSGDLVPGLDGKENPDGESWVTVERDVADVLDPDAGATDAHDTELYAETAHLVDVSDDPSLEVWRDGAADFLDDGGGEPIVIDYEVARVPAGPPAVAGSSP